MPALIIKDICMNIFYIFDVLALSKYSYVVIYIRRAGLQKNAHAGSQENHAIQKNVKNNQYIPTLKQLQRLNHMC